MLGEIHALRFEMDTLRRRSQTVPMVEPAINGWANPSTSASQNLYMSPSSSRHSTSTSLRSTMMSQDPSRYASSTTNDDHLTRAGHLTIDPGEGSRFLGPTAAAHLLPDREDMEHSNPSRPRPSPEEQLEADPSGYSAAFPFSSAPQSKPHLYERAFGKLPSMIRVKYLIDVYFVESSWRFAPVSRILCDSVFNTLRGGQSASSISSHRFAQLGMLFGVLASACLFDVSLPPHSAEARTYDSLSTHCLSCADFLIHTTVESL